MQLHYTECCVLRNESGVFLPAGTHDITFQFKLQLVQIGLAVTVVGLLVMVGLFVLSRQSK